MANKPRCLIHGDVWCTCRPTQQQIPSPFAGSIREAARHFARTPTHFSVSFDFCDDRKNANTGDFRDELMAMFEQAVLEGRMTNVVVRLDYAKDLAASEEPPHAE